MVVTAETSGIVPRWICKLSLTSGKVLFGYLVSNHGLWISRRRCAISSRYKILLPALSHALLCSPACNEIRSNHTPLPYLIPSLPLLLLSSKLATAQRRQYSHRKKFNKLLQFPCRRAIHPAFEKIFPLLHKFSPLLPCKPPTNKLARSINQSTPRPPELSVHTHLHPSQAHHVLHIHPPPNIPPLIRDPTSTNNRGEESIHSTES